jgi:protein ImuA
MSAAPDTLAALRRSLAELEQGFRPGASGSFSLDLAELDDPLGGGLARGALHDVHADAADRAAATGFAVALALRAAAGRTLVWTRLDRLDTQARLYPPGLAELGLDPARLLLVRARDAQGVLRAGAEAARCSAVGTVLIELWGEARPLDLTASRRLSLAAARSGVTTLLLRIAARPAVSAAMTRWAVRSLPSAPLAANAPGLPAFAITLQRHRAGVPGREWHVEWDRDRCRFQTLAPLPGPVVAVPAGRAAGTAEPIPMFVPWRRAG